MDMDGFGDRWAVSQQSPQRPRCTLPGLGRKAPAQAALLARASTATWTTYPGVASISRPSCPLLGDYVNEQVALDRCAPSPVARCPPRPPVALQCLTLQQYNTDCAALLPRPYTVHPALPTPPDSHTYIRPAPSAAAGSG